MPRAPRPSKEAIKAKADRAEKRSAGKPVVDPPAPITPAAKKASSKGKEKAAPPVVVEEVKKGERVEMTGRPSSYKPEYAEQAAQLCKLGATDEELGTFFKVSTRTIYRWKALHEAFCQAIKVGGESADTRVERSLYARAVGYTYDAVKIMQHKGDVIVERYREHVPPDTTAMIFWLKNRQPERWRDVHRQEHTGKDGGAIQHALVPQPTGEDHLEEITRRYALKTIEVLQSTPANGHANGHANAHANGHANGKNGKAH